MSVSSVSSSSSSPVSYDLGALQSAAVNDLVGKLNTTYSNIQSQASDASVTLSAIGQVQSGFATIQSQAATLSDPNNLGTAAAAQSALQSVIGSVNAQAALVSNVTASGGILASDTGIAASAQSVRSLLSSSSLIGAVAQSSFGLKTASDGTVSLDTAAFNAAYSANPSGVTQVLSNIGSSVNSAATSQISAGGAVYSSQTKVQAQYTTLSQQQADLYGRISNLQNGGVTASTLQDYTTISAVVSSAATRINALTTTATNLNNQVNLAGQKQSDLNLVQSGVKSIQQNAQAVAAVGTGSSATAATAGAALQGLFDSLNTQTNLLTTLGAAKTSTTPAGTLNSETSLRNSLNQIGQSVTSTLLTQLGLGNIGVSQSNGLFTLDQSAFSTAYNANQPSVQSFLSNIGGFIQQSTNSLFQSGSTLTNAQVNTQNQIVSLQAQIYANQKQIDAVQADPFSTVPVSSYQKILTI